MNKRAKIEKKKRKKQINQLKKPISKAEKELKNINASIRWRFSICIILLIWLVIVSLRINADFNINSWKTETIKFRDISYNSIHYYRGGYNKYYTLYQENGEYYDIMWYDCFDNELFSCDVRKGDKLTITWYYWLGEKKIRALESEKNIYRSLDEAKAESKSDGKAMIIFLIVTLLIEAFMFFTLIKRFQMKKRTNLELKSSKKNLIDFTKLN